MPIWKVPLVYAAVRAAAPAIGRAISAIGSRAPAAAQKAAPVVTKAAQTAKKAAPLITRTVTGAAKAAPIAAVGYGLARMNQPPVVPPRAGAPIVDAASGLVDWNRVEQMQAAAPPRAATVTPAATAVRQDATAPAAAIPRQVTAYVPQTGTGQTDIGTGTGGTTPSGADAFAPLIAELTGIVRELQTPDNNAVAAHHLNQFLAETDRMGAEIRTMFEAEMGTVDPATMAALGAIRETVNQQRSRLMDDMNRRGLLQSGIWLQMEDRINQGQLSAEQQALSTRLTNLRNQMTSALQNLAQARLEGTRQLTVEGIRTVEDQAQRRQQAALAALGLTHDAARDAAAQQRWAAEQAQAENEFNMRYNELLANLTGRIPAGMPGAGGLTADAQHRANQLLQAPGDNLTMTERTRAAAADAHAAVDAAMTQGATPEAIKNNIRGQTAALIRDGVNVDSLLLYVDEAHLRNMQMRPPATAPQTPGLYTRIDQQLGGWLPWGAPRG